MSHHHVWWFEIQSSMWLVWFKVQSSSLMPVYHCLVDYLSKVCVCVCVSEARDLGVGYYAFSQDEDQRKKQRETLDMLRDQVSKTRSRDTANPLGSRYCVFPGNF